MNAMTNTVPARAARSDEVETTVSALGGQLLTMAEVTAWTGFHRATIHKFIKAGTFPPGKKTGARSRRWTRAEIRAWAQARD